MRRQLHLALLVIALGTMGYLTFAVPARAASPRAAEQAAPVGRRQAPAAVSSGQNAPSSDQDLKRPGSGDAGTASGGQLTGASRGQPTANKSTSSDATPGAPSQPLRAYWDAARNARDKLNPET